MEGEISVARHELLELLAKTEQRLAEAFEQRLADALQQRFHKVEARLDVVEARLPCVEHCWAVSAEPLLQPQLTRVAALSAGPCADAEQSCYDLGDVELRMPKARRLIPEARHLMPHPDKDDYTALSAREVPPLQLLVEVESPMTMGLDKDDCCDEGNEQKEYKDLPMDTWGSGIICIIQEVPKIFTGTAGYAQYLRTIFVISCLFVNIVLQYLLLWFVLAYVCNPAVAKLQTLYKAYHGACFDESGLFLLESWDKFPYRQSLCDMALSEPAFISTMLVLWCVRMLGEFRSVIYLVRSIEAIPKVPHSSLMINLVDNGTEVIHEIVGLTTAISWCLHLFIILPKLGINICLTYIGIRWLVATVSFSDLILNALALGFITDIDEMLLTSVYPERMIRALGRAKFAAPRKHYSVEEDEQDLKKRYHQAIYAIVALICFVCMYLFYLQQVLPGFTWDVNEKICLKVRKERYTPQCHLGQFGTECFPYGIVADTDFENRIA